MFQTIISEPLVIQIPALSSGGSYDYVLAAAVDVANFRSGAVSARLHAGFIAGGLSPNPNAQLTVLAMKAWPFPTSTTAMFITSAAALTTTTATANTPDGVLLASDVAPLGAPALCILARIEAVGGAVSQGTAALTLGLSLFET